MPPPRRLRALADGRRAPTRPARPPQPAGGSNHQRAISSSWLRIDGLHSSQEGRVKLPPYIAEAPSMYIPRAPPCLDSRPPPTPGRPRLLRRPRRGLARNHRCLFFLLSVRCESRRRGCMHTSSFSLSSIVILGSSRFEVLISFGDGWKSPEKGQSASSRTTTAFIPAAQIKGLRLPILSSPPAPARPPSFF